MVGAPEKAAAEKGREEEDTVVPLWAGAGHLEFVEEPVEVEEGGGEFVEDEGGAVEVDEGALIGRLATWMDAGLALEICTRYKAYCFLFLARDGGR